MGQKLEVITGSALVFNHQFQMVAKKGATCGKDLPCIW